MSWSSILGWCGTTSGGRRGRSDPRECWRYAAVYGSSPPWPRARRAFDADALQPRDLTQWQGLRHGLDERHATPPAPAALPA